MVGNGWKNCQKIRSSNGHTVQVDCGRGFRQVFETFADSMKTKHELDFIIDIAS